MTENSIDTSVDTTNACPLPSASVGNSESVEDEMIHLLAHSKTIAVVGASPNVDRTSHQVTLWLIENTPYQIFLVNPMADGEEIEGHGFYPTIADLPIVPDIVDVFRRADHVSSIANAAMEAGSVGLWLQLGVINDEAAAAARDAGMTVVQNRCIKIEYSRLRSSIEELRSAH